MPVPIRLYFLGRYWIVGLSDYALNISHIHIESLHGIEQIRRHRPLLEHLFMLIERIPGSSEREQRQNQDDPSITAFLLGLDVFEGAPDVHRVLTGRNIV